jgi:amidohydrolase
MIMIQTAAIYLDQTMVHTIRWFRERNVAELSKIVHNHTSLLEDIRRDLHRIPETAYTEKKTSAYITDFLQSLDLSVQGGIAGYGVLASLDTGRPGATLMLRADMDALPINEETGLPYSSTHPNVMHACGHDGHMSMVLVSAAILTQLREKLKGTIKFVFQPAEEGPGGALPMIEQGVMDNPTVDYSIGCHLWPAIPEGFIGVREGTLMASVGRFDIKIFGKGGHGAMPHQCVDALEVGTQVVNALQRISSRHMNPLEATVVTVGSFHAGTAFNVIPGIAELSGTVRTFSRETWLSWEERLDRIIGGVCDSMGACYKLNYEQGYPPLKNNSSVAALVRDCARDMVGEEAVCIPEASMVGEDMAYYLERSDGCFFLLGVGRKEASQLHNARFDFNVRVLPLGAELFCRCALRLLGCTE